MAYFLDTEHRLYPANTDLTLFTGESDFDYKARGTLETYEQYSRIARLSEAHVELMGENYRGLEVEILYDEKYYDKIGRELI